MTETPPCEDEDERLRPSLRRHETYKQDKWTVVDIEDVDKVFATESKGRRDEKQVRMDLDGFIAKSMMNDVGESGDNVNTSIWLTVPDARQLVEYLEEALDEDDES